MCLLIYARRLPAQLGQLRMQRIAQLSTGEAVTRRCANSRASRQFSQRATLLLSLTEYAIRVETRSGRVPHRPCATVCAQQHSRGALHSSLFFFVAPSLFSSTDFVHTHTDPDSLRLRSAGAVAFHLFLTCHLSRSPRSQSLFLRRQSIIHTSDIARHTFLCWLRPTQILLANGQRSSRPKAFLLLQVYVTKTHRERESQ